jgi:phospholipase/carboxylesterase/glyoxalase family protein
MGADFTHQFLPGSAGTSTPTLLLLHGTGGDEHDLIPLGQALIPGAAILSPRGKVLERGAPRFFRRLAEGVLDLEDLRVRTDELADFVAEAAERYGFVAGNVVAAGFSNGANIATSLLLRRPGVLSGAALFSPMLPFEPESLPELTGTAVFIGAGQTDPLVPVPQVERLAELLRKAGAEVELRWDTAGHTITQAGFDAARQWAARVY